MKDKLAASFNTLADAHEAHCDYLQWLKAKVANLEDRSHQNNIKICCFLESVQLAQLSQYVPDLFRSVTPSLMQEDLAIVRIHCIPKLACLGYAAEDPFLASQGKNPSCIST